MRAGSKNILFVDDDRDVRDSCGELLTTAGYLVETAVDGPDALEKLKTNTYDLIILDINMPGQDGIDLYYTLLAKQPYLKGKVLFITGDLTGELDALGAFLHEKTTVLIKPFNREKFLEAIRSFM